jgi:hypothetical protein
MLRRNPQTGQWERRVGDGWEPSEAPVGAGGSLDQALASSFEDIAAPLPAAEAVAEPDQAAVALETLPAARPDVADSGRAAGPNGQVVAEPAVAVAEPLIDEIPGLVSTDGARGTAGAKGVRERLRGLRGRTARTPAAAVVVGPRAAKPSGPAVKDSTEARQKAGERKTVRVGPQRQRYANRPAPEILASRPKWVQELFEAHFRSDMALGLRKANNRMKISRMDYAIGWLVAFDKLREEPTLLRLKDK